MDSHNANGGFAPQNNNLSEEEKRREAVIVKPDNYVNIRTQSMVETSREELDERLAQMKAQQEAFERQQKIEKAVTTTKKTGIYALVGFLSLALVAGIVWIIVGAVSMSGRHPIDRDDPDGGNGDGDTDYGLVEKHKCRTATCAKFAEIDEKRFLIHDGNQYFLYNSESGESMLTTIKEQAYHEILPFVWSGKTVAVLDPETGPSALYSIDDNRAITGFSYDTFYTNSEAPEALMIDKEKYILAFSGDQYRLIDIVTGIEVAHSSSAVASSDGLAFGLESDGQTNVFSGGIVVRTIASGCTVYTANSTVYAVCPNSRTLQAFNGSGTDISNTDQLCKLVIEAARDSGDYDAVMRNDVNFVKIR